MNSFTNYTENIKACNSKLNIVSLVYKELIRPNIGVELRRLQLDMINILG